MRIKFVPMERLPSVDGEINPYLHDLENMGSTIGKNLHCMQGNHDTEKCRYLILIDTITGDRVKIEIEQDETDHIDRFKLEG